MFPLQRGRGGGREICNWKPKVYEKGKTWVFHFVLAILKFLISHLNAKYKEFVVTRHLLLFGWKKIKNDIVLINLRKNFIFTY